MRFVLPLFAMFLPGAFGASITSLAGLGANDLITFNSAPPGTILGATSNNGLAMTFFNHLAVGEQGLGWSGNFPANTVIVVNQTGAEAEFDFFANPIQGFGLTIDDGYSGNFIVTLDAFTAGSPYPLFIEQDSVSGTGGSLAFIGILESTADISVITVSVAGVGGNNDFAFGNVSLVDSVAARTTPEPGTSLLTLAGVGLLVLLRRTRSKQCSK